MQPNRMGTWAAVRRAGRVLLPLVALGALAWAAPANAQSPTSDQIRLLQSLSPAQRDAALEALRQGGDLSVSPRVGSGPFGLAEAPVPGAAPAGPAPAGPEAGPMPGAEAPVAPPVYEPTRVQGGDGLVIGLRKPSGRTEPIPPGATLPERPWEETTYRVDRDGRLWIPGTPPLTVLGWTESQVAQAVSSLDFAKNQEVMVRILPRVDLQTGLGVRPFGYEVLSASAGSFRPDPNAPVSKDYMVGPGDTFLIQLFGKESAEYELGVTRDGTLLVPKFGPMQVAGLPFDEARRMITDRIEQQAIGVQVAVTMGQLRTIQVFVLGDVVAPGAHVLSAFATPLHALMAAGGVRPNGSLRHVQVKRGGKVVTTIDLYDVLLKGDTSGYGRLQSGDVVFVPPISATVVVSGLVRRPAIYELTGGESVADVLALAGGTSAQAETAAVRLRRLDPEGGLEVRDLGPDDLAAPVRDGDVVRVFPRLAPETDVVTVRGHVAGPGQYAWHPGTHLTDLLPVPAGQLADTDPSFVLIARQRGTELIYLQTDLDRALADPGGPADLALEAGDEVFVFAMGEDRAETLAPEVARIQDRAVAGRIPDRTVAVDGQVHHSGRYPLTQGMRLTDLIVAAGDATIRAYPYEVEVTRLTVAPHGDRRETKHLLLDLARARNGDPEADIPLAPGDVVHVRAVPEWQGEVVQITGEVRFPGNYVIERGETVSSLLARAGGVTRDAFLPGAVFLREEVRRQEQAQLDRLANSFEQDLVRVATEPATFGTVDRGQALTAGRELLQLMRETKATGRMALTLVPDKDGSVRVEEATLHLVDGDILHIPRRPESVLVVGEVYHGTAHLFRKGERVDDYIALSGGINKRGDGKSVLVIHANGSVTAVKVGLFHSGGQVVLGDTIVVPQKVSVFSGLKLATDVTQILYQLALTAASAKAIGVL